MKKGFLFGLLILCQLRVVGGVEKKVFLVPPKDASATQPVLIEGASVETIEPIDESEDALNKFSKGDVIDVLLVTGGHSGVAELNSHSIDDYKDFIKAMVTKEVTCKTIFLTSCMSMALIPYFKPLLAKDGVILAVPVISPGHWFVETLQGENKLKRIEEILDRIKKNSGHGEKFLSWWENGGFIQYVDSVVSKSVWPNILFGFSRKIAELGKEYEGKDLKTFLSKGYNKAKFKVQSVMGGEEESLYIDTSRHPYSLKFEEGDPGSLWKCEDGDFFLLKTVIGGEKHFVFPVGKGTKKKIDEAFEINCSDCQVCNDEYGYLYVTLPKVEGSETEEDFKFINMDIVQFGEVANSLGLVNVPLWFVLYENKTNTCFVDQMLPAENCFAQYSSLSPYLTTGNKTDASLRELYQESKKGLQDAEEDLQEKKKISIEAVSAGELLEKIELDLKGLWQPANATESSELMAD